jgi:hypothetical protein
VRDEPEQVVAIYGRVLETGSLAVPVRIEATAADLHHLAVQTSRRQRGGAHLPGDRGGVLERGVEAA